MDELTRERYLLGVPWVERYRKPGPLRRSVPVVDWAVIEERRRVLDEGMKRDRPGRFAGGGAVDPAMAGTGDGSTGGEGSVWD